MKMTHKFYLSLRSSAARAEDRGAASAKHFQKLSFELVLLYIKLKLLSPTGRHSGISLRA